MCRLGVRVEVTRPGIGQVPRRRAAGWRDARWRGAFADVEERAADGGRIGDEGDDAHLGATEPVDQRKWGMTKAVRRTYRRLRMRRRAFAMTAALPELDDRMPRDSGLQRGDLANAIRDGWRMRA